MRLPSGAGCDDKNAVVGAWTHVLAPNVAAPAPNHRDAPVASPRLATAIADVSRRFSPVRYLFELCPGPWFDDQVQTPVSLVRFPCPTGVLSATLKRHADGQWRIHVLLTDDHPDVLRAPRDWKFAETALPVMCVASTRVGVAFAFQPPGGLIDLRFMWMSSQLNLHAGMDLAIEYNYPKNRAFYWNAGQASVVMSMVLALLDMRYRAKKLRATLAWIVMDSAGQDGEERAVRAGHNV